MVGTSGTRPACADAAAAAGNGGGGGAATQAGGNGTDDLSCIIGVTSVNCQGAGAGGGGFLGNGGDSLGYSVGQWGGSSFLNGGAGVWPQWASDPNSETFTTGTFGGGGAGWASGAGGSGYSGGRGCKGESTRGGGGGGGSYDINSVDRSATLQTTWNASTFGDPPASFSSGMNSCDGFVRIRLSGTCASSTYYSAGAQSCGPCP